MSRGNASRNDIREGKLREIQTPQRGRMGRKAETEEGGLEEPVRRTYWMKREGPKP